MNSFWSNLAKVLVLVVLVQAWFLYDMSKKNEVLTEFNTELSDNLVGAQDSLLSAQNQIEELKTRTIDGLLEETNRVVISGWESVLGKVQEELEKAREVLPKVPDSESQPRSENDATDGGESITGERT